MNLGDLTRPTTPAAAAALELATEYCSPALLNHVIRSWVWAEGFASLEGLPSVDHELLYVSAVLHDVGLTPPFDNVATSYEEAGGHVAIALTAGAGWPAARRTRALEVIVRHNWTSVDPDVDVEGYLLETATALDISGARSADLPSEFVDEVLTAYPRLTIADEFTASVTDQAKRKPTTSAHRIVHSGVAEKLTHHPFDIERSTT
jgi:hypothetical protein